MMCNDGDGSAHRPPARHRGYGPHPAGTLPLVWTTWKPDLHQLDDKGQAVYSVGLSLLWQVAQKLPLMRDPCGNGEILTLLLGDGHDLVTRELNLPGGQRLRLYFLASLTNPHLINADLIGALHGRSGPGHIGDMLTLRTFGDAIGSLLEGRAVLLTPDGGGLGMDVQGSEHRAVQAPQVETVVRGPNESFNEHLPTNVALLRRRIRDPRLVLEPLTIGALSRTDVRLCYIRGLINDGIVNEARRRLRDISTAQVLDTGYLEEAIQDDPYSIFPTVDFTERPDVVVAALMEGRFAILADGTANALIAPVTFWAFLQAAEDYYDRYITATFVRWLRYGFFLIALLMPALFIAITTFQQWILPTPLALTIAKSRQNIPFPALIEAFLMEISFELLREAGLHLPQKLGTSLSVVGALIIGQAAVSAGLVSWPVVVIVSVTAIANFAIPRWAMALSIRLLRFTEMIAAGAFGLPGILAVSGIIVGHMLSLRSFGMPYLFPIAPFNAEALNDVAFRAPHWMPSRRESLLATHWRWRVRRGHVPNPAPRSTTP